MSEMVVLAVVWRVWRELGLGLGRAGSYTVGRFEVVTCAFLQYLLDPAIPARSGDVVDRGRGLWNRVVDEGPLQK